MVEVMVIASMWESIASWFTPTILFFVTNLIIATIFIASNKHHDHHPPHVDHHSSSLTPIARVSSFLDRARSMNLSSYTAAESPPHYQPQPKTPNYTSSSRLAQSIHLPSGSGNITPVELSEPEANQTSEVSLARVVPSLFERVKSMKFSSCHNGDTFPLESDQIASTPGELVRAPSFFDRVKSFKISSVLKSEPSTDPGHNPDHHVIRSKSESTLAKKALLEMKKSRSEAKIATNEDEVDEEVDAKADDFITRFKQQLKLQRLESLVRYNDTLNRRSYK